MITGGEILRIYGLTGSEKNRRPGDCGCGAESCGYCQAKKAGNILNADKEKLQHLFDVMKKRIEKSDKYFRFFAGLNLQYHSIEDQKKYLEIMREWKADLRGKKD